MAKPPLFSVIMPVYNPLVKFLRIAIDSVIAQTHTSWELCIADDGSTDQQVIEYLSAINNPAIKVSFCEHGGISAASNAAIAMAKGKYLAFLDHDDKLAPTALAENAKLIRECPAADFIYSDEDKLDKHGRYCLPLRKPKWSPDYFHACMYVCHLAVYRKSLVLELGGLRSEFDGAQDYDLMLRLAEATDQIYHIPKILYHWRICQGSTAGGGQAKPWAYDAAQRALEAMLARSKYPGWVEPTARPGYWHVRRKILAAPLISIIIPSAGQMISTPQGDVCLLELCLASIENLTSYEKYEIIVIDGYDIPAKTLKAIKRRNVKVVRDRRPFNYSERINKAVEASNGEILCLLNDDTEVLNLGWLTAMLELAQQAEIGAVGAKLFFPTRHIQHIGVTFTEMMPGHHYQGMSGEEDGPFFCAGTNRNYLAVTAACLMVRRKAFDQVGGMDPIFPNNYNDIDFCLRLHQAGYRNVFTPYAQLIHHESASRDPRALPIEIGRMEGRWTNYLQSLGGDPFRTAD